MPDFSVGPFVKVGFAACNRIRVGGINSNRSLCMAEKLSVIFIGAQECAVYSKKKIFFCLPRRNREPYTRYRKSGLMTEKGGRDGEL